MTRYPQLLSRRRALEHGFLDAWRHVGFRVRTRVSMGHDVPEGSTGIVGYVAAGDKSNVFLAVAWVRLRELVAWYPPNRLLDSVWFTGAPIERPVPTRLRSRDFTLTAAFGRLGREVRVVRPPSRHLQRGEHGTVRHVIADDRLMVSVSWHRGDAAPDAMWFSRPDYHFYLAEN